MAAPSPPASQIKPVTQRRGDGGQQRPHPVAGDLPDFHGYRVSLWLVTHHRRALAIRKGIQPIARRAVGRLQQPTAPRQELTVQRLAGQMCAAYCQSHPIMARGIRWRQSLQLARVGQIVGDRQRREIHRHPFQVAELFIRPFQDHPVVTVGVAAGDQRRAVDSACLLRLTAKHLNFEYLLTLNCRVVRFNAR